MSHVSVRLRKKERMEVTLQILIDYYLTTQHMKGCSKKTLTGIRSNLGKIVQLGLPKVPDKKTPDFSPEEIEQIMRRAIPAHRRALGY